MDADAEEKRAAATASLNGVSQPCGTDCRHAERLRGLYSDWVWCHRPTATIRVRHVSAECRWFSPQVPSES